MILHVKMEELAESLTMTNSGAIVSQDIKENNARKVSFFSIMYNKQMLFFVENNQGQTNTYNFNIDYF